MTAVRHCRCCGLVVSVNFRKDFETRIQSAVEHFRCFSGSAAVVLLPVKANKYFRERRRKKHVWTRGALLLLVVDQSIFRGSAGGVFYCPPHVPLAKCAREGFNMVDGEFCAMGSLALVVVLGLLPGRYTRKFVVRGTQCRGTKRVNIKTR